MPLPLSFFEVYAQGAPLPAPLMRALRQIEIETAVNQAAIFRMHFDLSRTFRGDFDALEFDLYRPLLPISIYLSAAFGLPRCLINGYLRDARVAASNQPGTSTLEIVGMDQFGTEMTHTQRPKGMQNTTDSDFARQIFATYGMIGPLADIASTTLTRPANENDNVQRTGDAAFLLELANRNGYDVYIQPDPLTGRDVGHFHPPFDSPNQGVLSIDFGTQTNLNRFDVSYDMLRPTAVAINSTDPRSRKPIETRVDESVDPPMGQEPTLARFRDRPVERPLVRAAVNPAELLLQARVRVTRSGRTINASGDVDGIKYNRLLVIGSPVLVRGVGDQYSGSYYVSSVTHRISRDDYVQSFSAWRNALGLTRTETFVDPLAPVL